MNRTYLRRMLLRRRAAGKSGGYTRLLYQRPQASPEKTLANRLLLVGLLLAFVMLVFWLDRHNLRDAADGDVSFADVVYFTFITVTTVGYGDIVPIGERARLIDALLVTPIRIFVWFIFLGTAYEFVFQRIMEDLRMNALRDSLTDHIIVCGFGYAGHIAAREIAVREGGAERVVAIDLRPERLEDAAAAGYVGLRGDATSEAIMREAGAQKARAILVALSRDDSTVLAVLTARSLNEKARIIALVRDEENMKLVRKAGADQVVSPARIGGFLLADAVSSRHTTRFITDILTARGGEMHIAERPALGAEIGKRMGEIPGLLIVAVERGGKIIGFWSSAKEVIQKGDLVFAIEARDPQ